MSDIRYDHLHDTYVIIAPERLHRPDCTVTTEEVPKVECPFCEGNEAMTPPEIYAKRKSDSFANEPGWHTRVVPNLYKAVQIEIPHQRHEIGMFQHWEGFGAHEIIIDTPKHHTSMTQWSEDDAVHWLRTLRDRVADLRRDHRIVFISLFKNEGMQAGATQAHCHTQLIGLPIIPKVDRQWYERAYAHQKHSGKAMLESMILEEESAEKRIVAQHGDFTAFCPYASAYPFEVIISSKKHLGQIDTLKDSTIHDVASLLLVTLKKMKRQLGCFDFNLWISTPPLQQHLFGHKVCENVDDACRFAIRVMPRIYRHGGFEVSTGVIINPVKPELAAKLLRESSDE